MGCSNDDSFSNAISKSRAHFPLEHRPRMLKDFLTHHPNTSSSTGFKSFQRNPINSSSSIRTLIENDLKNKNSLTSRSKTTATSSAISTFQAIIIAVKKIHFIKSPSILPRSLSRRLSSKKSTYRQSHENNKQTETKVTLTIKDIIRWRSFRDIVEEKSQSLDFSSSSPHHYTTTTTTTASTPGSSSNNGSSWCDSDFTAEHLPCWNGNSEECCDNENEEVKGYLPRAGENIMEAATIEKMEERQQNSPVSVINIEFEQEQEEEKEESRSFERSKQKLMQKIQQFESLAILDHWMSMDESKCSSGEDNDNEEERRETNDNRYEEVEVIARQVLNHVKETSSAGDWKDNVERIVLDFFRDELCKNRYGVDSEMLIRKVKGWIDGEHNIWADGLEKKEACVKDMENEGMWNKFEGEQQELALAIANVMMGVLVDDLFIDLIS